MAVYVDPLHWQYGRLQVCHLWADDLPDLLSTADAVGVPRRLLRGHPALSVPFFRTAAWVHFQIGAAARRQAVHIGALETDTFGPEVHRLRPLLCSPHPDIQDAAARRLADVAQTRFRLAQS